MNDPLANALSNLYNAEKIGSKICTIKPASSTIKTVLQLMKDNKYIGDFEILKDNKGDLIKVNLIGRINKIGVIKPRFSLKKADFEKFEKRFLPAKDFGLIIVSTPKGIMTHYHAKEKNLGGVLLSYCY